MEKPGKKFMTAVVVAILLLPMAVLAGSLEPSGPPAPTMRTLDQMVTSWSMDLIPAERFVPTLALHGSAVLDKETGLVWQSMPQYPYADQNYYFIDNYCRGANWNNKSAWRLPTLNELRSLFIEYNTAPATPYFMINPEQHIAYWTLTPDIDDPSKNWYVDFSVARAPYAATAPRTANNIAGAWCVRGPGGN